MKKYLRYLGLGFLALALVVGVGASYAGATLTLEALTITSSGALTLSGAAASAITVGNAAQTGAISVGTSTGAMTLNLGTGNGAKTLNLGTGTAVDTINIGTGGTGVDVISIGDSLASLALTDAQWSVTSPGVGTLVNLLVTPHADTGVDVGSAGALSLGNVNATSVSICNDSPNCDSVLIATEADGGTITIGNASNTAVSITDDNWSVTTAGVATFVSETVNGAITLANGETLANGTNATFTFGNNADTDVTLVAADSSGATNLIIDTTTTGAITIGSADVTSLTVIADGTTDGDLVLPLTSVSGAEMVSNTVTATQLAATITFADADFVDLGAVVMNDAAAQGLRLPNSAGTPTAITSNPEGHIAWDATNNLLFVSTDAGWASSFNNTASANTWTGSNTFTFAGAEKMIVNAAPTDATALNAVELNFTALDTTSGTTAQYGMYLDNVASSEGADALVVMDNSDADDAVVAGLLFAGGANVFTTAIDASMSGIVTALNVGANAVEATELDFNIAPTGTTSSITSTASADTEDLTISVAGAFNASLLLASAGTGVDAIGLSATAGGIKISTAGTAASALDIDATGTVAGNAVTIDTTDGGIAIVAAGSANGDITLTAGDNFTLNGVTDSVYAIGAATTTGTITIGGTSGTGIIGIGVSDGAQVINIGTGAGASVITVGSEAGAASLEFRYGTGALIVSPTPNTTVIVDELSFHVVPIGGGAATEAETFTGLRTTAVVVCSANALTNAVTLNKSAITANTITFTFSADPGVSTLSCMIHNI